MYEDIINNHINGNISDANRAIKKLTKKQIIELIYAWNNDGVDIFEVLHNIKKGLL